MTSMHGLKTSVMSREMCVGITNLLHCRFVTSQAVECSYVLFIQPRDASSPVPLFQKQLFEILHTIKYLALYCNSDDTNLYSHTPLEGVCRTQLLLMCNNSTEQQIYNSINIISPTAAHGHTVVTRRRTITTRKDQQIQESVERTVWIFHKRSLDMRVLLFIFAGLAAFFNCDVHVQAGASLLLLLTSMYFASFTYT